MHPKVRVSPAWVHHTSTCIKLGVLEGTRKTRASISRFLKLTNR